MSGNQQFFIYNQGMLTSKEIMSGTINTDKYPWLVNAWILEENILTSLS